MTLEMWIALAILALAILFFLTEWLRVDVVAIAVVVALMFTGLLTTQEALAGFSNPAVLTIAALFVIGGAVMQTGLAAAIGRRILTIAGSSPARLTGVIMAAVALLSAFMSDTGTVAVLLPAIISLAFSAQISASKLLIPLSYGALLGGATTLIGTPPNLIVSDLLRSEGLVPFGFFDYTPIGLLLFAAGISFMLLAGRRLLPNYQPKTEVQRVETPAELVELYRLPEDLFRLRVRRGSALVGQSIAASQLRQDFDLTIVDLRRPQDGSSTTRPDESRERATLENDYLSFRPTPEMRIEPDDILIVQGAGSDVGHAAASLKLGVQPAQADDPYALISQEAGVAEILLPPRSSLVGQTLVEAQFGRRYKLTVLGLNRPGVEGKLDLKTTSLRFGDILLVQGPWQRILDLRQRPRDFVVTGQPEAMIGPPARAKAPVALLILFGMLLLMVTNAVSIAAASLLAALAMILSGCVSIDEAYEIIDWRSLVLVAGMLPMATALEQVGVVSLVAGGLTESLGAAGPLAVMAGLFLLTSAFTQVMSNTATTVLIAPVALVAAQNLDAQPYAFLMAVAVAASMAFATPVASPVNTLVMGAGDYRFSDYLKVGVPMILVALAVSLLALPLLWPL